jgi:hypothetical protein
MTDGTRNVSHHRLAWDKGVWVWLLLIPAFAFWQHFGGKRGYKHGPAGIGGYRRFLYSTWSFSITMIGLLMTMSKGAPRGSPGDEKRAAMSLVLRGQEEDAGLVGMPV